MLPQNLNYKGKIESAPAVSFTSAIQPQNGTGPYLVGQTIILNIPTQNNLVLVGSESYLKFKFTLPLNGATANHFRWDLAGAHGIIDRIRIFSGSNLLQDISNYNMLAKLIFSLSVPSDGLKGKYNAMAGCRPDTDYLTGDGLARAANAAATSYTYALNLISLIGSLSSSTYFPLFACTSASLRVEISLVSDWKMAFGSVLDITPTLTDVEYLANFIKLSDSAMEMIYSSMDGQPLQVCVPDWSNYQDTKTLNTTSTQVSVAIPAKFSSLRAIFVSLRTTTGALTFFPHSSTTQGISQYFFRVGAQILPSKPPDTSAQMYCECIKAIGSLSDILYTPVANMSGYTLKTDTALDTTTFTNKDSGCFFVGLDLENYVNAPKSSIFAGYNSNNDDIYFVGTYVAGTALTAGRFDAFALYDSVLVFENNTCYRKF